MSPRNSYGNDDARRSSSRKSDAATAISEVLRAARVSRRLTQEALAAKLGLRQRQISDLERGAVDARLSTIRNVARALELELMLIPRPLIAAVDALQRAGSEGGSRPLYALDDEEVEGPTDEAHGEVGDARPAGRSTERARSTRESSGS